MIWFQLPPIECEECGQKHIQFQVFFRTDGLMGLAVKCECGNSVEHYIKWEDAIESGIAIEEAQKKELEKTAKGRQELKKQKPPKGNA